MPVLDTNFLIALRGGDERAARLLEELHPAPLLVPSVVAVEFLSPYGDQVQKAFEELARAFTLVHTDEAWVLEAARLRKRLAKEKRRIRLADFWIATWALLHETEVVTRDRPGFEPLGVKVRSW